MNKLVITLCLGTGILLLVFLGLVLASPPTAGTSRAIMVFSISSIAMFTGAAFVWLEHHL